MANSNGHIHSTEWGLRILGERVGGIEIQTAVLELDDGIETVLSQGSATAQALGGVYPEPSQAGVKRRLTILFDHFRSAAGLGRRMDHQHQAGVWWDGRDAGAKPRFP